MLTTISLFFICSGFVIALIIANDLVQNKQSMKIMNVVWVLTALWASYLALWAYFKFGMETAPKEDGKDMDMGADMKMDMSMKDMPMNRPMGNMDRPHWQSIHRQVLLSTQETSRLIILRYLEMRSTCSVLLRSVRKACWH